MKAVTSNKRYIQAPTLSQTGWMLAGLAIVSICLFTPESFAASATDLATGGTVDNGLGDRIGKASADLGTGFWAAVKVIAGACGLGMVAYSLYGMTLGRKKDEREYPLFQTLAVGIGGALMLSLLAFAELAQTTVFGDPGDPDNQSEGSTIFDG